MSGNGALNNGIWGTGKGIALFAANNITKKYGKKLILKGVDFTAQPGDAVCITGKNGCGKTTLLRILSGALPADGGELSFFGERITYKRALRGDNPAKIFKKYCGYLPQEDPLIDELTALDNLRLWGGRGSRITVLADRFKINDFAKKKVSTLSGGMKRRLSLAIAFVNDAPVLILDEPSAALDLDSKTEIAQLLRAYREGGGIIIMSSHDEREIRDCSRVYRMEEGILI